MWTNFKVFIEFVSVLFKLFFFFTVRCRILAPQPGIKHTSCVGRQSLNHWPTREVPDGFHWPPESAFPGCAANQKCQGIKAPWEQTSVHECWHLICKHPCSLRPVSGIDNCETGILYQFSNFPSRATPPLPLELVEQYTFIGVPFLSVDSPL